MTLEGLSSICAKLEPTSSTSNEISCNNLHRMLFTRFPDFKFSEKRIVAPQMLQFTIVKMNIDYGNFTDKLYKIWVRFVF